jgi:hypothetical protein
VRKYGSGIFQLLVRESNFDSNLFLLIAFLIRIRLDENGLQHFNSPG